MFEGPSAARLGGACSIARNGCHNSTAHVIELGMRILFLDQYGKLGGGQQVLLELARATSDIGWRVKALLPSGECVAKLRTLGVDVDCIPECQLQQGRKDIADVIRLALYTIRILVSKLRIFSSADMFCANGGRLYLLCFLASILSRKPAVYYVHLNLGTLESKLLHLVLRSKYTRAVVVPSPFIKRKLLAHSPQFADPRVLVLENGLDARFNRLQYEDRFSGQALQHVGIVGRVSPEKGQDVLVPLAKGFPDIQFHVLGDAAFSNERYYAELQEVAPENIYFHGWVDDLPAKISEIGLQVCIVPSRCPQNSPERSFEAAPLVPLQVAALSCLVLMRRLGALEDVALRLGMPLFDDDEELMSWMSRTAATEGEVLASQVSASYESVAEGYSSSIFHQRLQAFFLSL